MAKDKGLYPPAVEVYINRDQPEEPVRWLKFKYWAPKLLGKFKAPGTTGAKRANKKGYIQYPRRPWIL